MDASNITGRSMAQLFVSPFLPAFSTLGALAPGATMTFYLSGTSTESDVWADAGLTEALPNPVVADSVGRFPPIYLDPDVTYRVVLKNAGGSVIDEIEDYTIGSSELRQLLAASTGAGLIGYGSQTVAGALSSFKTVEAYGAVGDGVADDTAELLAMRTAENRYVLLPGKTYRVTASLPINNYTQVIGNGATLLIDHAGSPFSNGAGASVLFAHLENFNIRTNRVNASTALLVSGMSRSFFSNIRIDRAGAGQSFGVGVRVQNGPGVSLWNTFINVHVTCATGTGFFLEDNANDNTFYGCRLVNAGDLELVRGLYFGACSGSQFDGGSLEAIYKNGASGEAHGIEFAAAATECLVQRTRTEGYSGSANAFGVKWNGSAGNSVVGLFIAGLSGGLRDAVGNNTFQAGTGGHYIGGSQVRISATAGAPAVDAGAIKFNTTNNRFQGFRDSARDFCMSPAFFAHDMNGQALQNVGSLSLQGFPTGTTVGAAGGASALPATPLGYLTVNVNGTNCRIPYYN